MHDFIEGVGKQHDFLMCLWGNAKYKHYYSELSKNDKEKLDGIMARSRDRQMGEIPGND